MQCTFKNALKMQSCQNISNLELIYPILSSSYCTVHRVTQKALITGWFLMNFLYGSMMSHLQHETMIFVLLYLYLVLYSAAVQSTLNGVFVNCTTSSTCRMRWFLLWVISGHSTSSSFTTLAFSIDSVSVGTLGGWCSSCGWHIASAWLFTLSAETMEDKNDTIVSAINWCKHNWCLVLRSIFPVIHCDSQTMVDGSIQEQVWAMCAHWAMLYGFLCHTIKIENETTQKLQGIENARKGNNEPTLSENDKAWIASSKHKTSAQHACQMILWRQDSISL